MAAFHVKFEDGVNLPLVEVDAPEFRPILDGGKSQRVGAVAVTRPLAVQFTEPLPDLLAGRWD